MVAEGTREVAGVKREHRKKLTASEFRSAGLPPDLVTRKVRSADRPDARKKFVQCLTNKSKAS